MKKLHYLFMVLLTLGCQKDRLLQVEANIAYLDAKFENNIQLLDQQLGTLEEDTANFVATSRMTAAEIQAYADNNQENITELSTHQNDIQAGHLERYTTDLELIRSVIRTLDNASRELEEKLNLLDGLRVQLAAARQDETALLIEEIFKLESEIDDTYILLEEELYNDFLSLSEEAFSTISEIIGSVEGSQEVLEVIVQQIVRDRPEYVAVEEIGLPKIGGLLSIPESVYSVEYETSIDPSIITASASSTTVTSTVGVIELTLSAIKDNDCKDLHVVYSDDTEETLTDVICDIEVLKSTTTTGTLTGSGSDPSGGTEEEEDSEEEDEDDRPVYTDTDRDGVSDEEDAFPNNPYETTNTSGHVYGDNFAEALESSEETLDEINQLIFDLTTIFTQNQIEDPDYTVSGLGPGWYISRLAQRLNTEDGSINILKNSLPEEHPYYPEFIDPILEVEQEILDLINSCEFTPIPSPHHSPELVGDKVVLRINDGFYSEVTIIPIGGTSDYFFTANPDAPFTTHKQFSFDENGIIQVRNTDGTFADLVRQDSSEPYMMGGVQVGLQWDKDLFPTDVEHIDVYYKTRCGNIWKLSSYVTESSADTPTEASNKRDTIDSWDHSYSFGEGTSYQLFNNPVYNP